MWGFSSTNRLRRLEESVEKLTRDFMSVRMEWDDAYHRLSKMMGRIAKSEARMIELREEAAQPGGSDAPAINGSPGILTQRQKEIQQQILRRRAHL